MEINIRIVAENDEHVLAYMDEIKQGLLEFLPTKEQYSAETNLKRKDLTAARYPNTFYDARINLRDVRQCDFCGVPMFLHQTCCGWSNATLIIDPANEHEMEWKRKWEAAHPDIYMSSRVDATCGQPNGKRN